MVSTNPADGTSSFWEEFTGYSHALKQSCVKSREKKESLEATCFLRVKLFFFLAVGRQKVEENP